MLFNNIYPVTCHTDHVGPESVFVAVNGYTEDGTKYIQTAIEKGATTIVLENNFNIKQISGINYIFVQNSRIALAEMAAKNLGYPARQLKFVGITGTCGKTTTTYLVDHILRQAGYKTAMLGSIKNKILDKHEDIELTTQTSDYIQMFLNQCVNDGVEYVIMEVSSHGLALNRVYGILFDVIGFTNLSPEHMDFHLTMDDYFQTKYKIFSQLKPNGTIVINTDNSWGKKAFTLLNDFCTKPKTTIGFGQNIATNTKFSITDNEINNLQIECPDFFKTTLNSNFIIGDFNAYNITMAALICKKLGVDESTIKNSISIFHGVPGRLQCFKLKNGASAFIDFAHKPDAMEKVLKTLRSKTNNLIVIFGCGGNRDKTKRPVMGRLAALHADFIIVTDDNPRDEDRQAILDEIIVGIPTEKMRNVSCIPDRAEAIKTAALISQPNSIIAILGKGPENYYLIKGRKFHFDDFEEISKY